MTSSHPPADVTAGAWLGRTLQSPGRTPRDRRCQDAPANLHSPWASARDLGLVQKPHGKIVLPPDPRVLRTRSGSAPLEVPDRNLQPLCLGPSAHVSSLGGQISFHNSPATFPLRVFGEVHVLPHPPHAPIGLALLQRRLLPSHLSHQPPADVKGALTSCWDRQRAPVTTHFHERAPLRRPYRVTHRGSRFPFAAPSVQTD